MENNTQRRIHPLTAVAAVSVTLFSLAGIGAMTGIIPTTHSQTPLLQSAKPVEEAPKLVLSAPPVTKAAESKPVVRKAAAKPAKPVESAARQADEPVNVAKYETPDHVAQNSPIYRDRAEPARLVCYDCAVIESVREIEKKGAGSGVGAVAGGALGGVLGNQTGAGRGKDVMTVIGVLGGAVAGHAIEKQVKKVKSYEIAVRFDDGSTRLITQDTQPAWRSGDRVKVVNGVISSNG